MIDRHLANASSLISLSWSAAEASSAKAARLTNSSRRVRCAVPQAETHGVADAPAVEVFAPAVHLGGRHARGIAEEGGQQARFVNAGLPQRAREVVIAPNRLGPLFQHPDRDA